jgi:alkylated DNA repair dioxygenase AlkB
MNYVNDVLNVKTNSVLVNYYPNGSTGIGKHADSEADGKRLL